jgi:hypothetical protein
MGSQKALADSLELPTFSNQMRHFLAGFLAAYLAGCGWNKPNLPHFPRPLFIMVGFSWWAAEVVLPEMHRFMDKGRKYLLRRSGRKVGRIKGYFIGHFFLVCGVLEALSGEVAVRPLVPLHGNQARGEHTVKQFLIEPLIGRSQAGIARGCRVLYSHLHISYDIIIQLPVSFVNNVRKSVLVVSFCLVLWVGFPDPFRRGQTKPLFGCHKAGLKYYEVFWRFL